MEIKLFGRSLFEFKGNGMQYLQPAFNIIKESKYIPDFKKLGNGSGELPQEFNQVVNVNEGLGTTNPTTSLANNLLAVTEKATDKQRAKLTPKNVYELEMLHDKAFRINTEPEYVEGQVSDFKDKLAIIKAEEYDMRRGTEEIASILMRMENRKKYKMHKDFFDLYPYTTNGRIASVVKKHDYLKLGEVAQFLADMPKEAVQAMKAYDAECMKLCEKKAVFYIIADKKDFKNTDTRRDPILLAQSPYGHFWQILGAWDKEMLFLEDL